MSRRWRPGRGFDVNQLQLDWTASTKAATLTTDAPASQPATGEAVAEKPLTLLPLHSQHPDLVQVLPWDFVRTFPVPLPDAIESGALREEDAEPETIRSMHQEMARQLSKVLADKDKLHASLRTRQDPTTGQTPSLPAARKRLERFLASEPGELERSWQAIIGVHEAAFGAEAAEAFAKAIRARHAGIEIIPQSGGTPCITVKPETHAEPSTVSECQARRRLQSTKPRDRSRVIARMPVPRPLADAVAAGHFGVDEKGKPINPSEDEVHAITRDHSELLIELFDSLASDGEKPHPQAPAVEQQIQSELARYAEDFGERATRQLEAYCRRQAKTRQSDSPSRGR